jgi:hypothetical protein
MTMTKGEEDDPCDDWTHTPIPKTDEEEKK